MPPGCASEPRRHIGRHAHLAAAPRPTHARPPPTHRVPAYASPDARTQTDHEERRVGYGRPVRRLPAAWRPAAGALALVATSGCSLPGFGAPEPKSTQGESIYSLWQGFFLASLAVAALVWG